MSLGLALALQSAVAGAADPAATRLTILPQCASDADGDIVVCGNRSDRFRLPLPVERDQAAPADHRATTGSAALTPATRCGIFQGERRCSKREAKLYGYGAGRDSITLLSRLGTALIDPDAELGGPAEVR